MMMLYGADENYLTPSVAGVPAYENAKQVITSKRRLVSLYAFNSSGDTVYVAVADSAAAMTAATRVRVYPVESGGFASVGVQGALRFENGIYVKAFTEAALTNAAGNVMLWDVNYTAYH